MTEAANVIHVEPDSEFGRLLDHVVESDAMLEKDGVHYRVNRVETPVGTRRARRHRLEPERILEIIGIGESAEGSDIARYKDEYIADAVDHRGE